MNYKNILVPCLVVVVVLLLIVNIFNKNTQPAKSFGAVRVGDQYQGTTTPQVADATNLCPARIGMASSTTGTLGTVNIFNANTGAFTIYDATTTNIALRNNIATSSLILAEIPGSPTETSYPIDVSFRYGLLVDYAAPATVSTTSISYRCES